MKKRIVILGFFAALTMALVFHPLELLISSAERGDYYSHIPLIPLITAYLLHSERKRIFQNIACGYFPGGILILIGLLVRLSMEGLGLGLNANDYTTLVVFSAIMIFWGGFIIAFGTWSARRAVFPLLFLLFMAPIPGFLMDHFISALQVGSTEVSYLLFQIIGVPIYREGFSFHLPGLSVEVAKQCSGIRSSLALVITVLIASHLFLRTAWRKWVLILAVFPITIIKNSIRILAITLLAAYVDMSFLTRGWLHQSGGILFFLPALFLLGGLLFALRKSERI